MRIFFCYIVVILIALQSINAIAENNVSHQDSHQGEHQSKHQDSDHHNEAELLAFQAQALNGSSEHSDADHPDHLDCHSNHCHHSQLIYLDLSSQVSLLSTMDKQVITKTVMFNSLPISPDSRPPIV